MSALPLPSLQVLDGLGDTYPALRPAIHPSGSLVQRGLAELRSLLKVQATTFAIRHRVEAAFLRYRRFVRSARFAAVEAEGDVLAARVDASATSLRLAPAGDLTDLAIKIGVLIALSEAGSSDSTGFPGAYLRAVLANIHQLTDRRR